jgi:DNA polymerase-4
MSVAGDPENRHGIILASNILAKRQGVKTAETIYAAKQKCPDLVLVPPRHHIYAEFCERVNAIVTVQQGFVVKKATRGKLTN